MNPRRLKAVPVFEGLGKDALRRIADCAEEVRVGAGEQLLHQGRFAFEFFAIESGTAEVMRDGSHLAGLGPGDVFGELGALAHEQRNASVVSTSPATLICLRAQDFRYFTEELPELARRVRRVVDERIRGLEPFRSA